MTISNELNMINPYPSLTQAVFQASSATQLVRTDPDYAGSWSKEDKTPLTVADLASQAIILRELSVAAPGETVFAEEDTLYLDDSQKASKVRDIVEEIIGQSVSHGEIKDWVGYRGEPATSGRWFVDPLDGTKGFVKGLVYAVGIARSVEGLLECSWLAVPCREDIMPGTAGRLFRAVKNGGAFSQPLDNSRDEIRLKLPETSDSDKEIVVVGSRAHGKDGGPKELDEGGLSTIYVPFDSQAKYAGVATDRAQLYVRHPHLKFGPNLCWDHAPGVLLVEEAGGIVTDLNGQLLDFSHGQRLSTNQGILAASNRNLHQKALKLLCSDS